VASSTTSENLNENNILNNRTCGRPMRLRGHSRKALQRCAQKIDAIWRCSAQALSAIGSMRSSLMACARVRFMKKIQLAARTVRSRDRSIYDEPRNIVAVPVAIAALAVLAQVHIAKAARARIIEFLLQASNLYAETYPLGFGSGCACVRCGIQYWAFITSCIATCVRM
jgi:hypothetical protein